ncbi:MAG: phage terminase large subunit [Candidatus Omnitrophica bacterium]|nr:phage terminase large subunit [Candidatus Omnitrophota bacterium]
MISKILKDVSAMRRQTGEASILAFAQTYLKHYLKITPSWAHKEVYGILQQMHRERGMNFVLAGPRDFGKSTLVTLIDVLYSLCYRKERFILILSNTAKLATRMMGNVKSELIGNPLIQADFPEMFEFNEHPKPACWKDNNIETRTGIKVISAGIHEAARGIRYLEHRPSLVIADDVEKGDAYVSLEAIERVKDIFNKTFLRIGTEGTNFIMLGTFFHPYCLLGEYLDSEKHPEWTKRIYRALESFPENQELWQAWSNIYNNRQEYLGQTGPNAALKFYEEHKSEMDKGAKSLWPEKWEVYDLMVKHENDPVVFSSEYQNMPIDPTTQIYKRDELHCWSDDSKGDEDLIRHLSDDLSYVGSCDPSMGSDYSAITVLVRDNRTKLIYVLVSDIRRRSVSQTIDDIVTYAKRFTFKAFGVESNNFQQVMVDQLKERCKVESVILNIKEIKNTSHKKERIISMQSITRTGGLRFNRNHRLLIDQLCAFPMGAFDDGPDSLHISLQLCGELDNGFSCWVGGKTTDPWTGEVLTSEEARKRAETMPDKNGLVSYKWYSWHRRG